MNIENLPLIKGRAKVPIIRLLPHEETNKAKVESLVDSISTGRLSHIPAVAVCADSWVIIDGHHRTRALDLCGFEFIEVMLIDYQSETILTSQSDDLISKDEIIQRAKMGQLLPYKTTSHGIRCQDGQFLKLEAICSIVQIAHT